MLRFRLCFQLLLLFQLILRLEENRRDKKVAARRVMNVSSNDTIADIMKSKRGKLWFIGVGLTLKKKMDAGKKANKGEKKSGGFEVDLKSGGGIMQMLGGFTVLRLTSMVGMMNVSFTKEELLKMNKKLNRIKKPKNVK